MTFEPVIGLEVHVQLATKSKLFSSSPTDFGAQPNAQANFVDTAQPGVLPVVNQQVVNMAIRFGLAINAQIHCQSVFARKHYFYPDLPKGYQISQHDQPIVRNGTLTILINGEKRNISIARAHLEEDAGKSLHGYGHATSGIDLNRAGCPLLEIVSDPTIYHPDEAISYLKALHRLVRWLQISDGDMSKGSMRCDANISLRPNAISELGTRVEIKNLNSFRFVHKALQYEIARQKAVLTKGEKVIQQTRLFNTQTGQTRVMRSKEEALDYRYFPDPDLPPLSISSQQLKTCQDALVELPDQTAKRYQQNYGLDAKDTTLLTQERACADYFDAVCQYQLPPKRIANWLTGEITAKLNSLQKGYEDIPISPDKLASLLLLVENNTVSSATAKEVLTHMWHNPETDPTAYVQQAGLAQVSDSGVIQLLVDEVVAQYPKERNNFQTSSAEKQKKLIGFFVGKVMQKAKGKANPKLINQLLTQKLG